MRCIIENVIMVISKVERNSWKDLVSLWFGWYVVKIFFFHGFVLQL